MPLNTGIVCLVTKPFLCVFEQINKSPNIGAPSFFPHLFHHDKKPVPLLLTTLVFEDQIS